MQCYCRDNYLGSDAAVTEAIVLFLSQQEAMESCLLLYVSEHKNIFLSFLQKNLQKQLISTSKFKCKLIFAFENHKHWGKYSTLWNM